MVGVDSNNSPTTNGRRPGLEVRGGIESRFLVIECVKVVTPLADHRADLRSENQIPALKTGETLYTIQIVPRYSII